MQVIEMDSKPALAPVVRRTATAVPARPALAAAPAHVEEDQQPDGAGEEGPPGEGVIEVQGGPMASYAAPVLDLVAKAERHGQKLLGFLHHPDVSAAHQRIADAVTLLRGSAAMLTATTFDPKAKASKAGLYAGAPIRLTSRSLSHYAGLFGKASRWTVISLHGERLLAENGDGRQIFFGIKEVEFAADAPADTSEA